MEGWQEFYRLYGDLLRRFALKRGLTEVEAVEVVLETTIGVVALAVHGWVRETGTSGNGVPAERASVFILPFRRPTVGEALEGSLADRMTDAFIDSLAAIRGVRRSPKRLAWVLGDEAQLLASLARTNDMRHVLTDWTQTVEGTVRLRLRLLDRPRSLAVWEETFSGRTNEVVDLERQSLGRLFAVLGIRPTPDESRRIDVLLANNQEAMRLDQAAERLVSDSIGDDALTREALRLAEQALQREPRLHDVDFLAACLMGTTDLDRSPAEVVPPMRRRLEAILEQDPTPIGVLDKLGGIALTHDWNWERYDLYLQRVFVFGTDKFAMLRLCRALWLRTHGYLDEARREQENS